MGPAPSRSEAFGSRHELLELNRQARALNPPRGKARAHRGRATRPCAEGFGHCLLPLERQELALRDLCAALESTTGAVCLAAQTTEAGRGLLPSDFLTQAFQARTGPRA
ncbi:MAG: hypothetical protein WDO13_20120 [Verrucomicrobiota bacterium]